MSFARPSNRFCEGLSVLFDLEDQIAFTCSWIVSAEGVSFTRSRDGAQGELTFDDVVVT